MKEKILERIQELKVILRQPMTSEGRVPEAKRCALRELMTLRTDLTEALENFLPSEPDRATL